MGHVSKHKYDPAQVQRLADLVRIYHDRGQPFDYEILIDGLKVVRRTNDPDMFFIFENFITPDSKALEVLFYVGSSNVNEKRMFVFGDVPDEKEVGLSGVEVDARVREGVKEGIETHKKEWQYLQAQKENESLKQQVADLEKQVRRMETEKRELLDSQSPLQEFLGQAGASFVESFLKRNPQVLKSIPGGEALAGLIDNSKTGTEPPETFSDSSVSFQAKSETPALSEEDRTAITFVNQLKAKFAKDEFDKVLVILQTLADDKSKIELILNHVNIKQ
ncbi:hypothetical protein KK083_21465 [Fulvivirgaceae bacterium PWU4]|uniref:Uncharacterized protein n=1 Tax=Chryseosolibacter histidini TaxID=2782349 RepID=A0AAP2DN86_9BACT|nr:hypothetical protein [Chryseosolibacter histidini]MBT1699481.1 hypothetical protein [Chryseosolibacter histidini]